jgi:ribose transport system ATP-binding protein
VELKTGQPPDADTQAAPLALDARGFAKSFGRERALSGVDIAIAGGEVVALLGENGSGKSTFVKILSGYHAPEPGAELRLGGNLIPLPVPLAGYREFGLSFVFQDLGLAHDLSVVENLYVAHRVSGAGRRQGRRISWRAERRQARAAFERYSVVIDPGASVASLSATSQALLAIVRAAEELREFRAGGHTGGVLVLDEPTVFLPEHEKIFLFDLVRRVAADGTAVLFVSHDMSAVREIAHRAVVLRDGAKVGDVLMSSTTDAQLVELVSGHREHQTAPPLPATIDEPPAAGIALAVAGLSGGTLRDVELSVEAGEILGVAGLLGSGSEDLLYALFGSLPGARGTLRCSEWSGDIAKLSPRLAQRLRIALVPADRKRHGLAPGLSVEKNMLSLVLDDYFKHGALRHRQIRSVASERSRTYGIRPQNPALEISALSGGNQQKVLLARWFELLPRVLLLHEPTQGVDVTTRGEIYEIMHGLCAQGVAIIWVSTDFDELATVADRIAVCDGGRIVSYVGSPFTRDRIISEVYAAAAGRAAREPALSAS